MDSRLGNAGQEVLLMAAPQKEVGTGSKDGPAEDKIPAEWGWESIWIPILVSFAALPFEVRRDVGSMYEVREDEAPIVEMLIAAGLCQNALYSSSNQPGRVQLPSAKMLSENSLSEH